MTLHKDFIIIFMLFIFSLCLVSFSKKFWKVPLFLKKNFSEISPIGPIFGVLQIKCLSKCSYFKKSPQGLLPWKIPGYALDVNQQSINPVNIYLFKVSNRNSRKMCHWHCSGVFIVKFEHILLLAPSPIAPVRYEIEIWHTTALCKRVK